MSKRIDCCLTLRVFSAIVDNQGGLAEVPVLLLQGFHKLSPMIFESVLTYVKEA